MKNSGLHRRQVLRGLLGGGVVALSLPWLEALHRPAVAYAGDSGFPTRFLLYFWGNGNLPEFWTPTGEGESFELSEQLASLESLKHKICVVSGMSVHVPNVVPHAAGAGGLLSGHPLLQEGDSDTFAGPSIDQVIAAGIGGETLYRSLQTGATNVDGVSYNGPNSRNPPECDPYGLYARLFGETFIEPGGEGLVDPKLGLRRSALDAVMGDIQALQTRISVADRTRLEQHLTGVREIELRLSRLQESPPNLEACVRPDAVTGDFADIEGRPQISARTAIMSEMIAHTIPDRSCRSLPRI